MMINLNVIVETVFILPKMQDLRLTQLSLHLKLLSWFQRKVSQLNMSDGMIVKM